MSARIDECLSGGIIVDCRSQEAALEVEHLFVVHGVADSGETLFRRTVQTASAMLWVLGAAEETLAALYDIIESVCGEAGLRAALAAAQRGRCQDAVA
jgi:hypothetical protein